MTDPEFNIARQRLRRRIGWAGVLVAVPWFAGLTAVGIVYRDWFRRHDHVSLLVLGVAVGGFLTAMYFMSRWLHERSGLVCRTCGRKGILSPTGECWDCNPLPRVVRGWWPVAVIIGLAGGAVGTIASTNPVRFGVLWLAGFVAVCVGVAWLRKREMSGR